MVKNPTVKKMIEVRDYCERRIEQINEQRHDLELEKLALLAWCKETEDHANELARRLEIEIVGVDYDD